MPMTPEEMEKKLLEVMASNSKIVDEQKLKIAELEKNALEAKAKLDAINLQNQNNNQNNNQNKTIDNSGADATKLIADAVAKKEEEFNKKLLENDLKLKQFQIENELKANKIKDVKFLPIIGINVVEYFNTDGTINAEKLKAKIIESKTSFGYLFEDGTQTNSVIDEKTVDGKQKTDVKMDAKSAFKDLMQKLLDNR